MLDFMPIHFNQFVVGLLVAVILQDWVFINESGQPQVRKSQIHPL